MDIAILLGIIILSLLGAYWIGEACRSYKEEKFFKCGICTILAIIAIVQLVPLVFAW